MEFQYWFLLVIFCCVLNLYKLRPTWPWHAWAWWLMLSLLPVYWYCRDTGESSLMIYRIVPNRSAVPNRRAPPFLKEKYAHIFLTWTKINLNVMLKSTQCKNLRIYFSFPQSLTDEQDHNYCTTDLLLQWNLWSGDTSAPQQKCPTEEVSPHHMDPLKRVETSGHNKTCWCRQVDL